MRSPSTSATSSRRRLGLVGVERARGGPAALAVLAPAAAHGHALGLESDPDRPVLGYLWLGFLHMVTGWDYPSSR